MVLCQDCRKKNLAKAKLLALEEANMFELPEDSVIDGKMPGSLFQSFKRFFRSWTMQPSEDAAESALPIAVSSKPECLY